jgi:hypothetical protein
MDPAPLLNRVLDDEGLTAGLDEPEAMLLVEAVTGRVRDLAARAVDAATAARRVEELCRRAREIAGVASARRDAGEPAARELAARYRLRWPAGAITAREVVGRLLAALDRRPV